MGLGLALGAFLKCLFNRDFAQEVKGLALERKSQPKGPKVSTPASTAPEQPEQKPDELYPWGAVHVLAELQKEGRFMDFIEEDLSEYEDDEIGSSVRSIHEGCKRALEKICERDKIIDQEEESSVRVDRDYDANAIKLTGRVSDMFPLKGQLVHPGWRVKDIRLPLRSEGLRPVLAPAEVEIG
jgi:hypothetical protein